MDFVESLIVQNIRKFYDQYLSHSKPTTSRPDTSLRIDMSHLLVKKDLALISNEHLCKFIINGGIDNSITFAMRVGNFKVFKYLLLKGVSVCAVDHDGMTAVHFAIHMQRLEFLYFLFYGQSPDLA